VFDDGGDDVETELEVTPGLEGWHTLNIPIANFVAAGLTTSSNIGQIVLSSVATNPVFLDNIYFRLIPTAALVLNDFNTSTQASDDTSSGGFWTEFDDSDNVLNYSTLTQIPAEQSLGSGSPVMYYDWGVVHDLGWGGYTSVYHAFDEAIDLSA
jgi:hypothetical protein